MDSDQPQTITQILQNWQQGDRAALNQLMPMIYHDLHQRAQAYMNRERPGHMLQATALINEVYLRLASESQVEWKNRNELFAVCANLMRQALVDIARNRKAIKNGGDLKQVLMEEALSASRDRGADVVALDDALKTLETLNRRQSLVVELRYFGGFTVAETAEALGVSPETVKKDWRIAKVWLLRELDRRNPQGPPHSLE
jgi:RNA polymerase sigma factor (TIGR02999 family)